MTYVGPYSEATLMYEPDEANAKGVVATPGTLLDYVAKKYPKFMDFMKKANLLSFYNCVNEKSRHTLFVPVFIPDNFPRLDANTCNRILKLSTVPGIVTTDMLTDNLTLYPLSHPKNDLYVSVSDSEEIKIRGKTLLAGDIFCKNGVIHVLSGMLWPTY